MKTRASIFEKIPKRKSVLENMINQPVILLMNDGKVFGAHIDDYESRTVIVYDCMELVDDEKQWIPQETFHVRMGEEIHLDTMPEISLSSIKSIYSPKNKRVYLDDVLNAWLNPNHKFTKHLDCNWNKEDGILEHHEQCDAKLHEALVTIITNASLSSRLNRSKSAYKVLEKAEKLLLTWMKEHGARIP
tara:strand:+ start:405 stop:971 length:567 start_codon:yes stop_codon:yes gene_type:complete